MSSPGFVHLRLHSEYLDRRRHACASTTPSRAAAADGMPALALTDLANAFGLVKFYQAARARGVKPIVGCDVWITNERERDTAAPRCCCCAQSRAGYLRLVRAGLSRAYRAQPASRPRANCSRDWFDEGTDGLIALSGARDGDVGQALLQGNVTRGEARSRASGRARFPQRYYLEVQRAGHADDDALVQATVALARRRRRCRSSRRIRSSSCGARISARTRRASASPRATCSPTTRRPRRFTPEQYFKTQARDGAAVRRPARRRSPTRVAIAQRCNLTIPLGKNHLPRFPDARRASRSTTTCATKPRAGLERRLDAAVSGSGERERRSARVRRAPRVRDEDHRADGLRRLLPDRRRLHQLGEAQRRAGRARAAARAPARWSRTRSASPISIRCATSCCSSASSIPSACRCPTSTSTSARTAATA